MAELIVSTPDSKETVDLKELPLLIGREKENDLVYQDGQLSRRHCVIKREENQFYIEDLDSKNGTFVNQKGINRTVLNDGDLIEIGDILLRFRQDASERQQNALSSSATQASRIVPWINPFQSTTDAPPGRSNSFYTGIMVTGFVLLALFGGYLLLKPVTSDTGPKNLLSQTSAWSNAPTGWRTTGASFTTYNQFEHVLSLDLSSEQTHSYARYQQGLPVDPSHTYRLSARMSSQQLSGLGGARITWMDSNGNDFSEELVLPLTEENQNWVHHSSDVLHPPSGAKRMKLSFFSAGEAGTVRIHNPLLQRVPSSTNNHSPRSHVSFDQFPLHMDASGQLYSEHTNDDKLLQSGLRSRRDSSVSSGWTTSIMNRANENGTLHWTGTAFTPIAFKPIFFTMQVSTKDQSKMMYELPGSLAKNVDDIGFQFRYQSSNFSSNLNVLTSDGVVDIPRGQKRPNTHGIRLPIGEQSVIFQFSHPLTVRYRKVSSTYVIHAFAPVDRFTKEETGTEKRINVGLTLMKQHPDNEQTKALNPSPSPDQVQELIAASSYKKALDALQKLQPFSRFEQQGPAYQELHKQLKNQLKQQRNSIAETIETARNLNSPRLLENAREQLDQFEKKLGTHAADFQLKSLKTELRSTEQALSKNQNENQERKLYRRFQLFRNRGQTELAREFAQELMDQTQNQSYREEARSFLNQNNNSN